MYLSLAFNDPGLHFVSDFGFVDVLRDQGWPSEYFFRYSSALEVLLNSFRRKIDLTLGIKLDRSRDRSILINLRPLGRFFLLKP